LRKKKAEIEALHRALTALKLHPEEANAGLEALQTATVREKVPAITLLRRPGIGFRELAAVHPQLSDLAARPAEVLEQVEIDVKYEAYISRERKLAEKIGGLDTFRIRPDFQYDRVKALSAEGREKLKRIRPETLGQASRISGVSPADISVLSVYLGK
jgi:tRNA uridine 5-carboxymethylaminomethyl modification enzyme